MNHVEVMERLEAELGRDCTPEELDAAIAQGLADKIEHAEQIRGGCLCSA
jgi:hypothetical protein